MRFRYVAIHPDGRKVRGRIDAESEAVAVDLLAARRLSPLQLKSDDDTPRPKLRYLDAARIASEVSRLAASGVPLESGVRLAAEAQESRAAKEALNEAARRLNQGAGPSQAFDGLDGAAGQALSAIIAAGERAGRLSDALSSAAPLFKATAQFQSKLVSLLTYPAIVALMAMGVLLVFLLVVIPELRPVLEGLGENLPTSARWLLGFADLAPTGLVALLVLVLIIIIARQFEAFRVRFRRLTDRVMLSPVGFGLASAIETALFARLFAALLKAGVPVGDAMVDAAAAVANSVLRLGLLDAASSVREGVPVDQALLGALGSGNLVVQASRLGKSGSGFADMVSEAGLVLAERAEIRLERFASIAGPVIILLLGSLIGLMVITLFSSLTALPDAALN